LSYSSKRGTASNFMFLGTERTSASRRALAKNRDNVGNHAEYQRRKR
jgi:hypothetical protein